MPVRYTCRLAVTRPTPETFAVGYRPLGDPGVRPLVLSGPETVLPPAGEMTAAEYGAWRDGLAGRGFSAVADPAHPDAPLVEARRTYEDEIPPGAVSATLAWGEEGKNGRPLLVAVRNGWRRTLPVLTIDLVASGRATRLERMIPGRMGAIEEEGGTEGSPPAPVRSLLRSQTATFVVPARMVTMLSAGGCEIVLRTNGYVFDAVPGEVLGAFVSGEAVAGAA